MKKVLLSMIALASSAAMVAEVLPLQAETAVNKVYSMDEAVQVAPAKSIVKADPQKVAYSFPDGTFHFAPYGQSVYPFAMVPANVPVTWKNRSQGFTEADIFEWTYLDEQEKPVVVESKDLEITYPVGMTEIPILKCGDLSYSMSYQGNDGNMHNYGLTPGLCPTEVGLEGGLVCMYSQFIGDMKLSLFRSYAVGEANKVETENWWIDTFKQIQEVDIVSAKVLAFSTVLPKPAAPYVLTQVVPEFVYQSNAATTLTVNIYKAVINADGSFDRGDLLTSSVADLPVQGASDQSKLAFTIEGPVDPVTGLQADFLKVDSAIIIDFTDFADKPEIDDLKFIGVCNRWDYLKATRDFTGSTLLEVSDGSGTTAQIDMPMPEGWVYKFDDPNMKYAPNHFMVNFDAYYPFVNFYDQNGMPLDSSNMTWAAPAEGGNVGFIVEANDNDQTAWFLSDENGNDVADWITAELGSVTINGQSGPFQMPTLTLTAAALPSGVTGRSAVVRVNAAMGGIGDITVTQGEGGVDAVIAEEIGVAVDGENFVIKANAEVNAVEIFNLAGQLVKTAELSAGNNVVAAGDLAKGVYVLKFNNNSTVKAVK